MTFYYYRFLGAYGREPVDAEDLFAGLHAKSALEEIQGPVNA